MQPIIEHITNWVQEYFNGTNCNAIVGISGGKDSAVVAAICSKALGKERVIGVLMPNGEQKDIADALAVIEHLGIKHYVVNIKEMLDKELATLENAGVNLTEQAIINIPARIRMSILYAISASENGRVANTSNLSEDWVGYATKYGDGAGDFSLLAEYMVQEVLEMAKFLELPSVVWEKAPADGLCGKTDEDNLGFTYAVLDKYIRTGVCEDLSIKNKIDGMRKANMHKLELMPRCSYKK